MRLSQILEMLKTSPDSQLNKYWLEQCINFKGTDDELLELFEKIYNTNDSESSKFIRTLVNPTFTTKYL